MIVYQRQKKDGERHQVKKASNPAKDDEKEARMAAVMKMGKTHHDYFEDYNDDYQDDDDCEVYD